MTSRAVKTAATLVPPRVRLGLAIVLIGLAGALLGIVLAGGVNHRVGPFTAAFALEPNGSGGTQVFVPPLGSLRIDSHDGPLHLAVRVNALRPQSARQIASDPTSLAGIGDRVTGDVRSAVEALAIRSGLAAVLGALLAGALIFRRWRRALLTALVGLVAFAGSAGIAAATWRPAALTEPKFSGLLASAPAIVGDVKDVVSRFDVYRRELAKLVGNVSELYSVASTLPDYRPDPSTIRVLSVSDIHDNPEAINLIQKVVQQFKVQAVFDTGDISDHGTTAETRFVSYIGGLGVPYVYVRGNHDSLLIQQAVAAQRGAVVLTGQARTVVGLRLLGAGDPRFTPDRDNRDTGQEKKAIEQLGQHLRDDVISAEPPIDVVLVHDPAAATPLFGQVPLVLAGHLHHREHHTHDGTLLFVQGSTGGAGLRGLEGDKPTPLEASVLYFDRATKRLQAYDDITVGGLGTSTAQISRHVVAAAVAAAPSPTPTASPTASPRPP